MRYLIIALIVFELHYSPVQAQDQGIIKGRVYDSQTRLPIPSVNVIVRGQKLGTTTDSVGSFRLPLPAGKEYTLVISHIAYEKWARVIKLTPGKEVELRIELAPATVTMKEVIILGKEPFVVSKIAENAARYKLDGNEFEKLGEDRMETALRYFLPDVVKPLKDRLSVKKKGERLVMDENDFTLYVNGVWQETMTLDDIDPFSIKRVLVWDANPFSLESKSDLAPIAFSLRRGNRYVVLIETR